MVDTTELTIVVVGAGIGGLAAAIGLRRAGHAVTVLEQSRVLGEVGAGISLPPNSTRALFALGLRDHLVHHATVAPTVVRRRWRDGGLLGSQPLGPAVEREFGAPYWHVHRADLHAALVAAATEPGDGVPVQLQLGTRVLDVESRDGRPVVVADNGWRLTADCVVGADGIHSTIRELICGADLPRYSGDVAYRALIPAGQIAAIPELVETAGTPLLTNWLGPGCHLVHYHVRNGTLLNLLAVIPGAELAESWSAVGHRDDLLKAFTGWDERVRKLVEVLPNLHRLALYDREPLKRWVDGNVCLLGDACHAMLPYQAQGAAQAIEDALVLGRLLKGIDAGGVAGALLAYQRIRRPRATEVQAGSRANRETFHLPDGAAQRTRDKRLIAGGGEFAAFRRLWSWKAPIAGGPPSP